MDALLRQAEEAEELVRRAQRTPNLIDRFQWLKCAAALYRAAGNEILGNKVETKAQDVQALLKRCIYRDR